MKHVRVRITAHGRAGEIHPMYGLLTESAFVERATARAATDRLGGEDPDEWGPGADDSKFL